MPYAGSAAAVIRTSWIRTKIVALSLPPPEKGASGSLLVDRPLTEGRHAVRDVAGEAISWVTKGPGPAFAAKGPPMTLSKSQNALDFVKVAELL